MKTPLLLFLVLVCLQQLCYSQDPGRFFESINNSGREFYLTFPPCIEEIETSDSNKCVLYIFGDKDQNVTVSVAGKGFSETRFLKAFEVSKWELSPDIAQIYRHFDDKDIVVDSLFEGAAIHVLADHRVIVNVETQFGKRRASYLAKPVDISFCPRGNKHRFINIRPSRDSARARELPTSITIVGLLDSTRITINRGWERIYTPTSDTVIYHTREILLNRGDVHHLSTKSNHSKLETCAVYVDDGPSPTYGLFLTTSYSCSSRDSSQYDVAVSLLGEDQFDHEKPITVIDSFWNSGFSMSFISWDSIPEMSEYIVDSTFQYLVYKCPLETWQNFDDPDFDEPYQIANLLIQATKDDEKFSYTKSYVGASELNTSHSLFLATDNQSDSVQIHLVSFENSSNSEDSSHIYIYNSDLRHWEKYISLGYNRPPVIPSEHRFLTTSATIVPGLYYISGKSHSVYNQTGQNLILRSWDS